MKTNKDQVSAEETAYHSTKIGAEDIYDRICDLSSHWGAVVFREMGMLEDEEVEIHPDLVSTRRHIKDFLQSGNSKWKPKGGI